MPPPIATLLTLGFIAFLFRRDIRERPNVTGALWIPLVWMLIICSRQPSEWLYTFGFHLGATSLEEGSPLDACVYFALIAAGAYVLGKRHVQLSEIFRNNQWLTIFFVYCFLAILWSDFPFVAFKRWIKVLGHPLMALIVLTESDPGEALTRLMKRCAYVIVPVSILFIKYYPQWGRGFSNWTGEAYNTGITLDKNALGADCLILGYFFFWHLLETRQLERSRERRNELLLTTGFLAAIWWLFSMAHSSTSLVSCVLGIVVAAFLGLRFVDRRLTGTYLVCAVLIFVLAESAFDVWGHFLQFFGKDQTLTDRTAIWHDVLQISINPFLGAGFESFWLGDRLKIMWAKWPYHPNQAHNGYIETYLNLGLIGLLLLIALLIATFWKSRRELLTNFQFGRFRLGFLVAIIAYNWTEAAFKNISSLWFVFYIIAMDYPQRHLAITRQSVLAESVEPEEELLPVTSRID
jgi:exopolysaccharide production protein ExoQ